MYPIEIVMTGTNKKITINRRDELPLGKSFKVVSISKKEHRDHHFVKAYKPAPDYFEIEPPYEPFV